MLSIIKIFFYTYASIHKINNSFIIKKISTTQATLKLESHLFTLLPWFFGYVKKLEKKAMVNFKIYDFTDWTTNN